MPKKNKKEPKLDMVSFSNMSSDLIKDLMYTFATQCITTLDDRGILTNLSDGIDAFNHVAETMAGNGVVLRRALIERRSVQKKEVREKTGGKSKKVTKDIKWNRHPDDKTLEYTKDIVVGNRYLLKKTGSNAVVGLLEPSALKSKKSRHGLDTPGTFRLEKNDVVAVTGHGFLVSKVYNGKKVTKMSKKTEVEEEEEDESEEEEEDESEEESEEESADESEEESADESEEEEEEEEEKPKKKKGKGRK
jgi:hypothetical protein